MTQVPGAFNILDFLLGMISVTSLPLMPNDKAATEKATNICFVDDLKFKKCILGYTVDYFRDQPQNMYLLLELFFFFNSRRNFKEQLEILGQVKNFVRFILSLKT